MTTQSLVEMTLEELKELITQVVDQRLINSQKLQTSQPQRSVKGILQSIESHRWTPPSESPTLSEMIVEERNQWRQGM